MKSWAGFPPGVKYMDNGYYLLPDGTKVHGMDAVEEAVGARDPRLPDTVAILAMGASSAEFFQAVMRNGGDIHQVADEVWAINAAGGFIKHDRLFATDPLDILREQKEKEGRTVATGMLEWILDHPGPIYAPVADDRIPGHVALPAGAIVNDIGFPYINTSVAWAVAFAMYLRVHEIKLYGCDFTYPNREVAESGRGSVEWLLGIAGERGIRTTIPDTSTLLDAHKPIDNRLYAFDLDPVVPSIIDGRWVLRRAEDIKAENEAYKKAVDEAVQEAKEQVNQDFGRAA